MVTEQPELTTAYEVFCRECEWRADGPVDLKGTANLLAGRHISRTNHVVTLKTIEDGTGDDPTDFYRGRDRTVSFEILRPAPETTEAADVRPCGPVDCIVESSEPAG